MSVLEIVKWKVKPEIKDSQLIEAVQAMVPDLKELDGFINQTLYKNSEDYWVDIYYWDSPENAHNSNDLMAKKASLIELLEMIELDTVTMEVLESIQKSE